MNSNSYRVHRVLQLRAKAAALIAAQSLTSSLAVAGKAASTSSCTSSWRSRLFPSSWASAAWTRTRTALADEGQGLVRCVAADTMGLVKA